MPVSTGIAYGWRFCYARPLKRLLSTNLLNHLHLHHRRSLSPHSAIFANLSSPVFPNLNFLTGNSLFSRMEGLFYRVVWAYFLSLVTCSGAYYSLFSGYQFYACPIYLDEQTRPSAFTRLEVEQLDEFCSRSGIDKNKAMVENLQRYGVITSKKVAEVMETIDRALFVPEGVSPYVDSPMAIGYNATISAPHMHATCLQLLEKNLQPGMRALDVGSGSGYLTACFAMMVGPQGRAVGVEHIPELVASSIKNIQKSTAAALLKDGCLCVHAGDGRQGWQEFAPYDAIHVGAAAPEIPKALIDQLKPGGRMVIPVGNLFQDLQVVDKNSDGSISIHSETSVRYVPLTSRDAQLRGY